MALIYIVDDVKAMRMALSLFVTNAGHEVVGAASGEEALAMVRERAPDLIITDILMPGMDGFEFVRQLRANSLAAKTHVVLHSAAYMEEDVRRLVRDCGVFRVVQKPATPEIIIATIEDALNAPPPVLQSPSLSEFAQEHQRLLNDKLVEKVSALEATTERLRLVLSLGQELAAESEPRRLLSEFCTKAKAIVSARYAAVGICDDAAKGYSFTNSRACDGMIDSHTGLEFLGEVITNRKSIRCNQANHSSCNAPDIAKVFSAPEGRAYITVVAAAPIATASKVYGWLCFGEKIDAAEFSEEDEQIAITLGAQLGLAYENARRLQSIRAHAEDLEAKIQDRTAELQRSNQALEQFAATAAHDLQAPLNTVIGYMQVLSSAQKASFDAETNESMEAVLSAAKRMQQFVRDALDYSRLDGASAPLRPIESRAVVKRAIDNLVADISASGASITFGNLPGILGDETQLIQLFQNLIHNALRFCRGTERRVHVWADEAGDEMTFSVKDTGIGIAPADFERVFDLFSRLHGHDEYPGSGIGLAVCKKIVARHGGRIWIDSKLGEGTTVHFTLKASASANETSDSPAIYEVHEHLRLVA